MKCPHCDNSDPRLLEDVTTGPRDPKHPTKRKIFCANCSKTFSYEV